MTSEPSSCGFEQHEAEVRRLTSQQHVEELNLCQELLECFLRGFKRLGSFTRSEDNDLQYAWFLLTARSFNSLQSAYALLEGGYYDQALMLIRAVEEDWLIGVDSEKNVATLKALLRGEGKLGTGKLTYTQMAKRVSEEFYQTWKYNYGELSTVAHARERAMRILVDPDTKILRLGGKYDRTLFIAVCHAWVRSATGMLDLLAKVLGTVAHSWQTETLPKLNAAADWLKTVGAKVQAELEV